jgi:uncharacterized membrane protein YfcA
MALGALVQGGVGFGALLIAAPLLVIIDACLVPGPALVSGLVLSLLVGWRDRSDLDWPSLGWALGGRVPGAAVGALILANLPASGVELLIGASVLLGVFSSASPKRISPTPVALGSAGFLAGIMGTATAIGGPPIALVYQHQPGSQLRATLSAFFLIGGALSAIALALVGRLGAHEIGMGLWLIPGTLVGYAASTHLARLIDRGYTRRAVLGLCTAVGLVLILRVLI